VPANLPWLTFDWGGAGETNPKARATFGIHKSPLIYSRENY
jgi:MSHA biogenesis protein MshQ